MYTWGSISLGLCSNGSSISPNSKSEFPNPKASLGQNLVLEGWEVVHEVANLEASRCIGNRMNWQHRRVQVKWKEPPSCLPWPSHSHLHEMRVVEALEEDCEMIMRDFCLFFNFSKYCIQCDLMIRFKPCIICLNGPVITKRPGETMIWVNVQHAIYGILEKEVEQSHREQTPVCYDSNSKQITLHY